MGIPSQPVHTPLLLGSQASQGTQSTETQPDPAADPAPIGTGWTNPFLCCGVFVIGAIVLYLFFKAGGSGWLGSGFDADIGGGGGGGGE